MKNQLIEVARSLHLDMTEADDKRLALKKIINTLTSKKLRSDPPGLFYCPETSCRYLPKITGFCCDIVPKIVDSQQSTVGSFVV
jgi:hypothetical protein